MKAYVYILYSEHLNRYYTGLTKYPDVRLKQHLRGKSHWTAQADDWKRVFLQNCSDTKEARQLEKRIKAQGAKRYLENSAI